MKGDEVVKVVSSGNINRALTNDFDNRYPHIDFCWHENIEQAERDLGEAEVLITYGEDLTESHIRKAKKLKWIMVVSAGMDEMPFEAIDRAGILVTNARGIHAVPMAEYSMHMMLHTARQTKIVQQQEKEHRWDRSPVMTELHEKNLVIVGAGAIGTEVARLAKAFRMHTTGINRSGSQPDFFDTIVTIDHLEEALKKADFIISVLPKMPSTDNLFSTEVFKKMHKEAVFINIGRGNAVDEGALIQALDNDEFRHAVLDVFKEEPLPAVHPFWDHPDITVTPHLSGISPQYQPRAMEIFEENLKVYINKEGEYINKVNPSKGY